MKLIQRKNMLQFDNLDNIDMVIGAGSELNRIYLQRYVQYIPTDVLNSRIASRNPAETLGLIQDHRVIDLLVVSNVLIEPGGLRSIKSIVHSENELVIIDLDNRLWVCGLDNDHSHELLGLELATGNMLVKHPKFTSGVGDAIIDDGELFVLKGDSIYSTIYIPENGQFEFGMSKPIKDTKGFIYLNDRWYIHSDTERISIPEYREKYIRDDK